MLLYLDLLYLETGFKNDLVVLKQNKKELFRKSVSTRRDTGLASHLVIDNDSFFILINGIQFEINNVDIRDYKFCYLNYSEENKKLKVKCDNIFTNYK